MASKLPSLAERSAWAVAENADRYTEEEIGSIPNNERMRLSVLNKLVTYDSMQKFLRAFGMDEKIESWEILSEVLKRRWDSAYTRHENTFRFQNKRVMCINRVCLTDYGYICSTTTGRVLAYEENQTKPKILGNYKSARITHIYYHKERVFVVFFNWKIRMWVRRGTIWDLSVIYEDAVALRGWFNCVMSGGVMAYTDGHVLEMYKLETKSASKIHSVESHRPIGNISICDGVMAYTSDMGLDHILHLMSKGGVISRARIEGNRRPTCTSVAPTEDQSGREDVKSYLVCVGFSDGNIAFVNSSTMDGRLITTGERMAKVMSIKATKHRVASSHSDGKIRVFQHDGTLVRIIDVDGLRMTEKPIKKKRRGEKGVTHVVVNENRMDLDMDESRLLCLDGMSHRVYCWDFSE